MSRRMNLVELRKQKGWLQKDVTRELSNNFGINITVSYYGMIEQGVRTPGLKLALAIANLYEKPVYDLFF